LGVATAADTAISVCGAGRDSVVARSTGVLEGDLHVLHDLWEEVSDQSDRGEPGEEEMDDRPVDVHFVRLLCGFMSKEESEPVDRARATGGDERPGSSLIDEREVIAQSASTMQVIRKLFAVAVLAVIGSAASAQSGPERIITLEECILTALEQNLDVQIVRYEPDISRYGLRGAYGVYDPELFAGGSRSGSTQPPRFVPETGDIPGSTTDTDSFQAGLRGLMPWGLTYSLSGQLSESTGMTFFPLNGEIIGRPVDQTQGRVVANLTQPLLRNFWIDGARLTIEFNRTQIGLSELQLELQLMNTVTAVEMAYYDLILAMETVKVQETALQLAQRLLDENRKRVEVGALAPLDEKQAEAQVATTRSDLLSARRMLAVQQNALKNLISSEYADWHGLTLVPRERLTAVPKVFNLTDSWMQALTRRPELLQSRLNLEQQGIAIQYRRNQLLPQLDVVGSYGRLGTVQGGGYYGRVLTDIREDRGSFYSIGGQIVFPLGNRTARSNYRAAQAEREQALLRLKQIEQNIMVQIDNGIDLARTQFERVEATRLARAYQEAALQAEEKKLESGKSTSFFVLQLQRDLTAASSAEVQALADYNKALVQLALAEGSVLDRNGIDLRRP
jgi:outer membrane protein